MAVDWTPVFVLPTIPLQEAVGCDIAAIAPARDDRVAALKRAHPPLKRLLDRFACNFGQKFEPAALILDEAAPLAIRDVTAVGSFQELVALSTVTDSQS